MNEKNLKPTNFLLELFSEEIPSRMQQGAAFQLQKKLSMALKHKGLIQEDVHVACSCYRLIAWVNNMNMHHESIADPILMLSELLGKALEEFTWPQSMRWDDSGLRWVRPLRRIVCLLGDEVVPLRLGNLKAGRTTLGRGIHIQKEPQVLEVPKLGYEKDAYKHWLEERGILIDAGERKASIEKQLNHACENLKLTLHHDDALLDEVVGLCESPKVYVGAIPERYLALPRYVLSTVLRSHQKYFIASDEAGKMAPYFFFVSPLEPPDGGMLMIQGNERVMCARLEDAWFLEAQDRAVHKEVPYAQSWEHKLEEMVWYHGLGSYALKTRRLEHMAVALAKHLGWDAPRLAQLKEAARLSKVDLVSQMVGEFPELQGRMGAHYARCAGVDGQIADAIAEHYRPLGPSDVLPSEDLGKVLALADKLDLIWTVFLSGDYPTGSRDPLGVRRAYFGILRILFEQFETNSWMISHDFLWKCAQESYELQSSVMPPDGMNKLKIYTEAALRRKNLPVCFVNLLEDKK